MHLHRAYRLRRETGDPLPEEPVPPDPVPVPDPDLPMPIPLPVPDPPRRADVEIVLRGSTAVVTGVVAELEERREIVEAVASLASITSVDDNLRPPAA